MKRYQEILYHLHSCLKIKSESIYPYTYLYFVLDDDDVDDDDLVQGIVKRVKMCVVYVDSCDRRLFTLTQHQR